jgi:release factor glutamine methyltransferase
MPSLSKKVFFANYAFHIYENVYEPAEDSFLFAENLEVEQGHAVIDMGTGCGILGIIAAGKASQTLAVDISPYAIHCAKENAKLNRVADEMFFMQGDLFATVRLGEKFDLILFNAPYLPSKRGEESSWLRRAWAGGGDGRQIIDRFICEAPKYLERNGRIFLMQSTLSDVSLTLQKLEKKNMKASIVAKQALPFFETIVLVRAEL